MESYAGTQSVGRAIALLKKFDDKNPEWSLVDLVDSIGLNKTTVFRLLSALEAEGLIRRTDSGSYALGSELIVLGGRAQRTNQLRTVSHEKLSQLSREFEETVTLEVLHQDPDGTWHMLVMDTVQSRHLVGVRQATGGRYPVHATSTGKAVLAYLPSDRQADILAQKRIAYTAHTRLDAEALLADVQQVLQCGYGLAVEELEPGLVAVAAPIFDHHNAVQAAISIECPDVRMDEDRLARFVELLKQTAAEISHALGYRKN